MWELAILVCFAIAGLAFILAGWVRDNIKPDSSILFGLLVIVACAFVFFGIWTSNYIQSACTEVVSLSAGEYTAKVVDELPERESVVLLVQRSKGRYLDSRPSRDCYIVSTGSFENVPEPSQQPHTMVVIESSGGFKKIVMPWTAKDGEKH